MTQKISAKDIIRAMYDTQFPPKICVAQFNIALPLGQSAHLTRNLAIGDCELTFIALKINLRSQMT